MLENVHNRWLYRMALATPFVAMLTLTSGALVTSKNAGMAFRDWPTSDGVNMLRYDWLSDFARDWDKFLEHGHRLAGIVIGCWAIALVVWTFRSEARAWVRFASLAVLLMVILQGLLGGFRVVLDERGLAMIHGAFAALVVSWMACFATFLSPGWTAAGNDVQQTRRDPSQPGEFTWQYAAATMCVIALAVQYLLGGMIRHHHLGLFEHFGMGIASLVLVVGNTFVAHRSRSRWIRRSGWMLQIFALSQVLLGLATWVLKFGLASAGYVAVADSAAQVFARTSHMLLGVATFAVAVMHLARVWRTMSASNHSIVCEKATRKSVAASMASAAGGAA